jgi:hypothetical protein
MGGDWLNGSRDFAVPLTKLQSLVLRTLAAVRTPDLYVGGGVAINIHGPRYSGDIDIFQDSEERLLSAAEGPLDTGEMHRRVRRMIENAETFVGEIRSEDAGVVFLDGGRAVSRVCGSKRGRARRRYAGLPHVSCACDSSKA